MQKKILLIFFISLTFCLPVFSQDVPADRTSKEYAISLLKNVDDSMYPKSFKSEMVMETFRNNRDTLKYSYTIYSSGPDKVLMEITYPKRDIGKKILLKDNNLWMYLPSVSRPIRLTRSQSFMGSTLSNEDISDTTWENDYDPEIVKVTNDNVLMSLKAKRKDVAYKKIEMRINDRQNVPMEAFYYGLSGKAIKKMIFTDVKQIAGRLRPLEMKMIDLMEIGAFTRVKMTSLEEVEKLPAHLFDQTQMGR